MDEKLREIQLCELEILHEFERICNKYDLRYYLAGGTLLGAVRHQGFIPWDDDIDVAMLREDYERFAKLSQTELGKNYFYQSPETDPYYFLSYSKIRKNGTEVYEERFRDAKFHKGVFIDIFPLDFCPSPSLICHFFFNVLAVMNYRGQIDSGELYHPYSEISGKVGFLFLKLFSRHEIVRIRQKIISLLSFFSSKKHIAAFSGAYGYYKEIFPYEWFYHTSFLTFEGIEFTVPHRFDLFLKQVYGADYLTPPPQKNCIIHLDHTKSHL